MTRGFYILHFEAFEVCELHFSHLRPPNSTALSKMGLYASSAWPWQRQCIVRVYTVCVCVFRASRYLLLVYFLFHLGISFTSEFYDKREVCIKWIVDNCKFKYKILREKTDLSVLSVDFPPFSKIPLKKNHTHAQIYKKFFSLVALPKNRLKV